jgi:RimJ/RimL family protein N-acetyltransferase
MPRPDARLSARTVPVYCLTADGVFDFGLVQVPRRTVEQQARQTVDGGPGRVLGTGAAIGGKRADMSAVQSGVVLPFCCRSGSRMGAVSPDRVCRDVVVAGGYVNEHHPGPPAPSQRLLFREMTIDDLDAMAALLGDRDVMRYYPRPKDRGEAQAWITWNQGLYHREGFGLWVIALRETGEFVGDCGLTRQEVEGIAEVEVGYHVRADLQRFGYATEAATACRDHARNLLDLQRLIAIIHPANVSSQRVAEKIGLAYERDAVYRTGSARIYATSL